MVDWYRFARIIVALNLAVLVLHAAAHVGLAILPSLLDSIFILAVMFACPVVSLALLPRTPRSAWALLIAFMGSFAYGALSHYVLPGPDSVFVLPASGWATAFEATTVGLAILEALGIVASLALVAPIRTPSGPAAPPA